ncbi:MAG: DUF2322 family protein [Gammaproteobacteria bacterium]|nr:DUF2322 family protein [Gammaproteobacteria bacterium]
MSRFEDNLSALPAVDWLARLEVYGEQGDQPVWTIENTPEQAGSLAIYYKMALDYGSICPPAAEKALELYAERTQEARARPGTHPHIDFLFRIIETNQYLPVRTTPKT